MSKYELQQQIYLAEICTFIRHEPRVEQPQRPPTSSPGLCWMLVCVCQCEDRLFTAAGTVLHRARPWTCPTVSDHLAASSSDTTANWARDVSTPPAVTLRQFDNLSRLQPSEEVHFFNRRRVVGSIPDFGVHVLLPAPPHPPPGSHDVRNKTTKPEL